MTAHGKPPGQMQIYDIGIDEQDRETTVHGRFGFPVGIYENVIERNKLGVINWHWHDELQLCRVTKGTVGFLFNGREYELREGEGIFINSRVIHMAKDNAEGSSYICVDFDSRLISSFPNSVFESRYVLPFVNDEGIETVVLKDDAGWQMRVLENISGIYESYSDRTYGYEFDILCSLLMIWKELAVNVRHGKEYIAGARADREKTDRLRDMLTFIQSNCHEKLRLDEISKSVHLSVNECCRFFKRNMKYTIFEYVTEYRISKSIDLLTGTDMSIADIAYETGFGSSSYYIEKFRAKTSMTPGEYRKRSTVGQ